MTYGLLTPDVPLGPFEGARVTLWSAQGKQAKLHSKSSCSYLRSAHVAEVEVRLEAATVGRLCAQCAAYGSWARPGTGLALFLDAVTGLGLLYELERYGQGDEDTFGDEEVREAASVLLGVSSGSEEQASTGLEDETADGVWEDLRDARHVRETVFAEWIDALASLHRVYQVLDLFPWLRSWAEPRVQRKTDHLHVLRARAGQLIAPDSLVLAAAVSAMDEPDVPADDPTFAPLGAPAEAARELVSLWRRWRSRVESSWDHPREQEYLVHHLASGMSSRRKGRDRMLEQAQALLGVWEAAARSAAADGRERVLVARLDDGAPAESGRGASVFDRVGEWERGVLASYMVSVGWERSAQLVVSVRVPEVVACRLLSQPSVLVYEVPVEGALGHEADGAASGAGEGLLPGVFDDTPVHGRRMVRPEHLRALRGAGADAEQLYAVLGVGTGVEVVALSVLEQRCAAGWQGVILAAASDLPDDLFETGLHGGVGEESVWSPRVYDPEHEEFGRSLSAAEGERVLVRLCEGRQDVGQALKSLVLARSVTDLRDLEAVGYDERGYPRRAFVPAVWNGLLAMEQLDLEPFASDPDDDWPGGSGLPLGVLASVQAYTTDASGRYQGRAHSPGCAHRRPYGGVDRQDDMVTIDELLDNRRFDPCSKCGGYAVRRLSEAQVAYYRAAHRLHNLIQRSPARHGRDGTEQTRRTLDELSNLDVPTEEAWFPIREHARQWRRVTRRLQAELQAATCT
ncbi:hypothetical protein [Streptomyces cyaneogriseus]|uniref:hypothetical protein n=1 Tax=Streptomyces cyaneogriseus TaxID=68192 RepID=UPI00069C1968|nr:hypothetical protein [Streptomyces cyaneogriseus]